MGANTTVVLGSTESYPLPGVTVLLRVEPRVWGRDEQGKLVQGCFRVGGIFLPASLPGGVTPPAEDAKLNKTIGWLTAASLVVGTAATLFTWGRK